MRSGFTAIGAALVLLGASVTLAVESAEPPNLERFLRWGPVRVRPGLEITNLGYDDNIFYDTTNPVSDYRATFSPKLEGLVLFGHRMFLTFDESLQYTTYLDNSSQNFVNQRGDARLTLPLRRMALFVTGRLDRTEDRPTDQSDQRVQRDDTGYGFGLLLEPGWRTRIELGWSILERRHDDPDLDSQDVSDRLDRDESAVALNLDYRLVGRTDLTLFAEQRSLEFRVVEESRSWTVQPGIDFGRSGPLSGSLRLGWSRITSDGVDRPQLSEPVGSAEIALRFGRGLTVRLEAERKPGFSIYRDATYYVNSSYGLRAVRYLNHLIGIEAGGSLGRLEFPGLSGDDERTDDIARYRIGVRLRLAADGIGNRIEYSLNLGRWRRESTVPGLAQSKVTVGFNATLGY